MERGGEDNLSSLLFLPKGQVKNSLFFCRYVSNMNKRINRWRFPVYIYIKIVIVSHFRLIIFHYFVYFYFNMLFFCSLLIQILWNFAWGLFSLNICKTSLDFDGSRGKSIMRASENPHLCLKSYSLLDRTGTIWCHTLSRFRINYAKQLSKGKKNSLQLCTVTEY